MADFRLGRLKFNWRDAWAPSTAYVIDDIVSFKGNTYVCVVNHTSAASEGVWATTDLNIATPRWQLHVPGTRIMGDWAGNTFYAVNDLVAYGGTQYLCTVNHTSSAAEEDFYTNDEQNYWDEYLVGTAIPLVAGVPTIDWQTGKWYKENDIVRYGNTLYLTTTAHTTGVTFDSTKFSVYLESVNFEDTWNQSIEYQPGDIVNYGGYTYIARTISTGKEPNQYSVDIPNPVPGGPPTPRDWDILTTGFDVKGEYDNTVIYIPGDVVQFGGNTYVKVSTGSAGVYPISTGDWDLVAAGLNWKGPWSPTTTYQVNDVVSSTSASWVNLTAHNINIDPVEDQTLSTEVKTWTYAGATTLVGEANNTYGTTGSPLASTTSGSGANATFIVSRDGNGDIGTITAVGKGTGYAINDTITIAAADIADTVDLVLTLTDIGSGTGGTNWQAIAQGESTLTLQNPGDILYRNGSGANVNLPIGSEGQILTVDSSGLPAWERNNTAANVYYVATDGTDDPAWGKNLSKPWRTIRYALAQTDGLGTADNIVTIFVKSGTYEEQLPLVTSPYTSVVGDNLRATVVKPTRTGLSDPTSSTITGHSLDASAKENRYSTMWYLTESVTLKDIVMMGMEGFTPAASANDSWDITQSDWQNTGVFLRLRADIAITGKSPYITQCSAFSGRTAATSLGDTRYNGGIGALIDKSIYATTSNGSMLFDSFTQFHDGGVGFWCKDLGNAEIVSSFTYYCHIGYTCTGGGRIRSLAGNNSYGYYGAVSSGTDVNEVPLDASVRGLRLNHAYEENSPKFAKAQFVVQGTEGGVDSDFTFSTGSGGVGANQTYTDVSGTTSGSGAGALFQVVRDGSGNIDAASGITVTYPGEGYAAGDTITIAEASVGGGGDLTITVVTLVDNYTTTNTNYALALILYKQDAGEVDGETTGEDYLLIEPVTGSFTTSKPIASAQSDGSLVTGNAAVRSNTKATDALTGIYGKVFTLTDLPVQGGVAVVPKKTGSVEFLDVTGQPQYTDDDFYTVNAVSDEDTASSLDITVTRQFDTPGAAATNVVIASVERTNNVATLVTNSNHGLVTGDEVVVVISNSQYQSFSTAPFERTTVTVTNTTTFTYDNTGSDQSNAALTTTNNEESRVYLVGKSGGSTNRAHPGGSAIDLYNVSNTTILIDNSGATEVSAGATTIPLQNSSWSSQISTSAVAAGNAFLMINNEIMQIDASNTFPSSTITVTRAAEDTVATAHTDGSVVYYMTKTSAQTTLSSDVAVTNGSGSSTTYDLPVFSISGIDQHDILRIGASGSHEFFRVVSANSTLVGRATITFSQPKELKLYNSLNWGAFAGQQLEIRLSYSQVRLTGHDFLLIGTGNKEDTNWPNQPVNLPEPDNEVYEAYPGRVYYTSTDQDGNFRVGNLFEVEQATGTATLNANAFKLSGLSSLRLGTIGAQLGAEINEFSTDITLGGEFSRDSACPTQLAVKTYVDNTTGAGVQKVAPTFTIQTLVAVGTTATLTSVGKNNCDPQDEIVITGANETQYNGRFTVQTIDTATKSLTFTVPSGTPATATGNIVAERIQKVGSELDIFGPLKVIDEWNQVGTDLNGVYIDITDTDSSTTSNIIDAYVDGNSKFKVDKSGNITAAGSLTVDGTLTTINSTNLTVADINVIIGDGATQASDLDGAGLNFGDNGGSPVHSFLFDNTNTRFNLTAGLDIQTGMSIAGTSVLTSDTLGGNIVNSSLTSVGQLSSLTVAGVSSIQSVTEKYAEAGNNVTGTVSYNFADQAIFRHNGLSGAIIVDARSIPSDAGKVHTMVIIAEQGGSAYNIGAGTNNFGISPNADGSGSVTTTVKWSGGAAPTPTPSSTDVFTFNMVNTGTSISPVWVVYGSKSSFA